MLLSNGIDFAAVDEAGNNALHVAVREGNVRTARVLLTESRSGLKNSKGTSVADPDPSDPYVSGPPGSGSGSIGQRFGSGSFYNQAKIVRKTYCFVIFFYFLFLKNDVNVPSKSTKQKT